jgi:hypothetical protein
LSQFEVPKLEERSDLSIGFASITSEFHIYLLRLFGQTEFFKFSFTLFSEPPDLLGRAAEISNLLRPRNRIFENNRFFRAGGVLSFGAFSPEEGISFLRVSSAGSLSGPEAINQKPGINPRLNGAKIRNEANPSGRERLRPNRGFPADLGKRMNPTNEPNGTSGSLRVGIR